MNVTVSRIDHDILEKVPAIWLDRLSHNSPWILSPTVICRHCTAQESVSSEP